MNILRAERLTLQRGSARIIEDLDCEAQAGEVVMLIGPNGAGKSTLLSALCGDLAPTQGAIWLGGQRLADWPPQRLACHRAMLRQHSSLSLDFTAQEVVQLGCLARRVTACEGREITARAMAMTGVTHLAGSAVPRLSGGEQARVHLARVLAQLWPLGQHDEAPRLLLLDEPCASLDPHYQHQVCAIVREFAALAGGAVVMTMHDMNLAAQYADRVMVLHGGRKVADGPAAQVLDSALVERCFGVQGCRWTVDDTLLLATRARR